MEKKSILKFYLSTSKKRYYNSEQGRTNCQSITVNTSMCLELIDIVRIVTNLLWGDEIHFLYECTKLNKLRVKYISSPTDGATVSCLSATMITRWLYCTRLEMVTGWVHLIVNVSNYCKELWIARRKHQHIQTEGKVH